MPTKQISHITIRLTDQKSRTINLDQDAQVIEWITNKDKISSKIKTKITIAPNAKVDYIFLLDKNVNFNFEENRLVEVGENAQLNSWYCYFGKKNNTIKLDYKIGANATLNHKTIFFGNNKQKINLENNFRFLSPESVGKFNIQGILDQNSKASNLANVIVDSKAQLTKADLHLKLFLLDNKSQGLMLPGLKVDADDIKIGHSASVSHINPEELFYLQSRGLTKKKIEKLLLDGLFMNFTKKMFSKEIVEHVISNM